VSSHFDNRSRDYNSADWVNDIELLMRIREAVSPLRGGILLDVGGGTGAVASYLSATVPGLRVVNLDSSLGMCSISAAKNLRSVVANAESLPVHGNSVDVVILRQVLHYVTSVPAVLAECRRVLRAGGLLIIGQFVPVDVWENILIGGVLRRWQPWRKRTCTVGSIESALRANGFSPHPKATLTVDHSFGAWLSRHHVSAPMRFAANGFVAMMMRLHLPPLRFYRAGSDLRFKTEFILVIANLANPHSTGASDQVER